MLHCATAIFTLKQHAWQGVWITSGRRNKSWSVEILPNGSGLTLTYWGGSGRRNEASCRGSGHLCFDTGKPGVYFRKKQVGLFNSTFHAENHKGENKPDYGQEKTDHPEHHHDATEYFHKSKLQTCQYPGETTLEVTRYKGKGLCAGG
jgi:hypothetical protein